MRPLLVRVHTNIARTVAMLPVHGGHSECDTLDSKLLRLRFVAVAHGTHLAPKCVIFEKYSCIFLRTRADGCSSRFRAGRSRGGCALLPLQPTSY